MIFHHPNLFTSDVQTELGIVQSSKPIVDFEQYKAAFHFRVRDLMQDCAQVSALIEQYFSFTCFGTCSEECIEEFMTSDQVSAFLNDIRDNYDSLSQIEITDHFERAKTLLVMPETYKDSYVKGQRELTDIFESESFHSFIEKLSTYTDL